MTRHLVDIGPEWCRKVDKWSRDHHENWSRPCADRGLRRPTDVFRTTTGVC